MRRIWTQVPLLILLCILFMAPALQAQTACTPVCNQVVNFDFTAGNTGFTSGLTFDTDCRTGTYMVGSAFTAKCSNWPAGYDHTSNTATGRFLIIDGNSSSATTVWQQTNIAVVAGQSYTFSFWGKNVYADAASAVDIAMMVDGVPLGGTMPSINQGNVWTQYSRVWTAVTSGTITIALRQNSGSLFRDFGIDDIYFGVCDCTGATDCQLIRNPNVSMSIASSSNLPGAAGVTLTNAWYSLSSTPQYFATGAMTGNVGSLFMWGTNTSHEAAGQDLLGGSIQLGTWYKLRLWARRALAGNAPANPTLRAFGFGGTYTWSGTPTIAGNALGTKLLTSDVWTRYADNDFPVRSIPASTHFGLNVSSASAAQANALVDSVQLIPVCCLLNVDYKVLTPLNGCCYDVYLNQAVDNISVYGLRIVAPTGFTIASSTAPSGWTQTGGGTSVVWKNGSLPMSLGVFSGQLCLNSTSGATTALVTYEWLNDSGQVICSQQQELTCPPPCIEIDDSVKPVVTCIGDSAGVVTYTMCVSVRNNCSQSATLTASMFNTNNINIISVVPPTIAGSSTAMICVTFKDVPPSGTYACVKITGSYASGACAGCSSRQDSVCVELPACPCLTLSNASLACVGPGSYQLTTTLNSPMAGTLSIVPLSGSPLDVTAVSPTNVPPAYNGIVTAAWLNSANVNAVCFVARMISNGSVLCVDTICVDVPPCTSPCPCPLKLGWGPTQTASLWGYCFIGNSLTLSAAMKIKASIVSAQILQTCGSGSATNIPTTSLFTHASLPGFVTTGIGTSEVTWTNYLCKDLNNASSFLGLAVLPDAGRGCTQRVRVCIRYTHTDCTCRTCDTLVCYDFVRTYSPFWAVADVDDASVRSGGKAGERVQAIDAIAKTAVIEMTSNTEGKLVVTNTVDPTTEPLTMNSLTLMPDFGVSLKSMTTSTSGWTAAALTDTGMHVSGSLAPGASVTFDLIFDNDAGNRTWNNALYINGTSPALPQGMLISTVLNVPARTPGAMGGDTLVGDASAGSGRSDVRTYALRFTNGNHTGDSIATVVIRTSANMGLLATGPGTDTSSAELRAFQLPDTQSAMLLQGLGDGAAFASSIAPGASFGPIYVTVSGAQNASTTFDYETRNAAGDVISRGEVTVNETVSGVQPYDEEGTGSTPTIALSHAVPNPATQSTTIHFRLTNYEPIVSVVLQDAAGRFIETVLQASELGSGEHTAVINTSKLASGTYFYTVRTATQSQTRKVVVQH